MILSDRQCNQYFRLVLAAAALLLFVALGHADIYILDEAKNAQCAKEMWQRGDWIVPTFNGELRTDKPALHYWFMVFSYQLFGFGYWQARLFSAVFGLATIIMVYRGARRLWSAQVGLFAAAALALSPHFIFEFRLSVPDPYLIFFTTAGLLCGLLYVQEKTWNWLLLAAVSLALATLAKGPVALALPGLCLLIYIVLKREWGIITNGKWLVAAVVYVLVALPWYLLVHQHTDGAFTQGFLFDHNLNRFSSEKEGHGANFFIVPAIVLVGMLPFSLFLFSALKRKMAHWKQPLFLFSFVVVLVYVVFFGISSTKLPNYAMPCYPFVSILSAAGMQMVMQGKRKIPVYAWTAWLLVGLALAVGGYFALKAEGAVLQEAPTAWGLLVLTMLLLAGIAFQQRNAIAKAWLAVAAGWFLLGAYAFWFAYPRIYENNPATRAYQEFLKPGDILVAYKAFNPAFLVQNHEPGKQIFMFNNPDNLKAFIQSSSNPEAVRILTRKEFAGELEGMPLEVIMESKDLFELPTSTILAPKGGN